MTVSRLVCPRCRTPFPSTPEIDRWLSRNEIEGFDRFTFLCPGCGSAMPVTGAKRVPMARSKFASMALHCPHCRAHLDKAQLRTIDATGKGLFGRCTDCSEWITIELKDDA